MTKSASMKTFSALILTSLFVFSPFAYAGGHHYGGGRHTTSHGGKYPGGRGSSHKGGHYKSSNTGNHYGTHK
jgi:hypothetical protein